MTPMTAPQQPTFEQLMAALAGLSTKLAGREGNAIREHIQRLGNILALQGPEPELRARAAAELEQLVEAIAQLAKPRRGPSAKAIRDLDLGQLAGGLRTFAAYLRAPTGENQAQVEDLVAKLQGAAVLQPVPLDELRIDGTIEELAVESARRHGLDPAQMALAFVNRQRFVTSTLIGATTMAQLKTNVESAAIDLSEDVIGAIEAVHRAQPNPCP